MKKITKITKTLLLGTPLLLSGCMGINSNFDCNVSSDGKCVPMGTIHKMADLGEFNEQPRYKIIENNNIAKTGKYPEHGHFTNTFFASSATSSTTAHPLRSNETIQKIWIGPYEDESGNYHEAANVYAVVKKASWLAESEQSIKD